MVYCCKPNTVLCTYAGSYFKTKRMFYVTTTRTIVYKILKQAAVEFYDGDEILGTKYTNSMHEHKKRGLFPRQKGNQTIEVTNLSLL